MYGIRQCQQLHHHKGSPKRRMKDTLFTRHRSIVEPMMIAKDRKVIFEPIHTMAVNQAVTSLRRNVVLYDRIPLINISEKELTRDDCTTLNEEITSDIQKHNIWKEHLDVHWYHMHNIHILWKTKHGLSNRAPPTTHNNSITLNNKITNTPKQCQTRKQTDPLTGIQHYTHHFSGTRGNTTKQK